MDKNRVIATETKKKIIKKYDNECCFCRVSGNSVPLEFSLIKPFYQGGDTSEDNLILLCPNCHRMMESGVLKSREFIDALGETLSISGKYQTIEKSVVFGNSTRFEADLIAQKNVEGATKKILIECKSFQSMSKSLALKIIAKMKAMSNELLNAELVLAVHSRLTDEIRTLIESEGIHVWDIEYLALHYSKEINAISNPIMRIIIGSSSACLSNSQKLLNKLKECAPGRRDCYVYQNLIGQIIEEAFCPPLLKPLGESCDFSQANRRDFVIPNYANEGFWAFLRKKYNADYIVVDAKNYTRKVKKSDVLQVANYLKPHGAGMFGLIFSRNGGDSRGCEQTLREQWMVHNKMIIVLDDQDVENILVSSTLNDATDVIGRKIEDFRLSM
ncbi:HNH endonuclease [Vibrio natriegens]|uniref:HNH endonuclease n=1 Tax=Vibrio natriegens TaxID=691 RepID=UPI0009C1685F|nr:HNH endonuclease signature motif containing protein [Vibrio natriegens]